MGNPYLPVADGILIDADHRSQLRLIEPLLCTEAADHVAVPLPVEGMELLFLDFGTECDVLLVHASRLRFSDLDCIVAHNSWAVNSKTAYRTKVHILFDKPNYSPLSVFLRHFFLKLPFLLRTAFPYAPFAMNTNHVLFLSQQADQEDSPWRTESFFTAISTAFMHPLR